jgi:hypothetical protein
MDMEKPRTKSDLLCPLLKKKMSEVCHTCAWWIHVRGKHPQGEEIVDHWNCAIAWMPVLMIENSQMQRQTGAAVESFRNEVVSTNQVQRTQWEALVNGGSNALDYRNK